MPLLAMNSHFQPRSQYLSAHFDTLATKEMENKT